MLCSQAGWHKPLYEADMHELNNAKKTSATPLRKQHVMLEVDKQLVDWVP